MIGGRTTAATKTQNRRDIFNRDVQQCNTMQTNSGHLFHVELEYFFHIHRDADEDCVVSPVVARVSGNDRPDWTRSKYRHPRYFLVLWKVSK